ncbi:hypothetical protein Tco_0342856, partial [Tanacetum coccineum]
MPLNHVRKSAADHDGSVAGPMTEEKELFHVKEEEVVPVKVEEQVVEPKVENIEDDVIHLPK